MWRSRGRTGLMLPGVIAWPLLAGGFAAAFWGMFTLGQQTAGRQISAVGPRIEDIRQIAKLAVLRVQVADAIEGRTRGARAVVLVHGDADVVVDLDAIEIAGRDDAQQKATLKLPTPRVDRPRVDHERTRVYQLEETGLAAINPFADPRQGLLEDCMRAAQEQVRRAVHVPDFVARAQAQADALLKAFYSGLGWDVEVVWE